MPYSRCHSAENPPTISGGGKKYLFHGRDGSRHFDRLRGKWWSQTGSNRRPPACKAGALPTELWPPLVVRPPSLALRRDSLRERAACLAVAPEERRLVGLGRFELPTSRLSSARSNQLSYRPESRIIHEKKEKRRRRRPAYVSSHRPDSLTGTVVLSEPIRPAKR